MKQQNIKNISLALALMTTSSQADMVQSAVDVYKNGVKMYDSVFAKGTDIGFNYDDEGHIRPDLYIPINWSNEFSSTFEYRADTTIEKTKVGGNYDDSSKKTTMDKTIFNINVIEYKYHNNNSIYSFGVGYSTNKYDKNQKGFATTGATTIEFDNNINIDVKGLAVYGEAIFRDMTDNLSGKFDVLVLSGAKLDVTQDTSLTGYPNGKGSSSENLDLIYELKADFIYDMGSYIDLGFETRYKILPLKYNLKLAKSNNTFEMKNYDIEEKISYNAIKIYFKTKLLGSLRPTIGYSTEKTSSTDNLSNASDSETQNKLIFSVSTKF